MDLLREHLEPTRAERSGRPNSRPTPLMALSLAYLFGTGALLTLVWLVNAGSLGFPAVRLVLAAVASYVVGAILLPAAARSLPLWAYQLILAAGTAVISAIIYGSGETASSYAILYMLVALYAAYFFTRLQAAAQVALIAVAYAAVLVAEPGEAAVERWLTTIGALCAAAFLVGLLKERLEGLIAKLTDAARTDVLTGLLNRRGFQELFETELERARRSGRPLSLLVGDLDHFKLLNDRFGHSAGDRALEHLAEVLATMKRRIDTPARIGGEEFALIVPESSEHDAYMLAERLRISVREAFEAAEGPLVTISFGVASFPNHGATTEALLHSGDQALYAAKELGRDRTVIHNAGIANALAQASSRRTAEREGYLSTVLALAEALDMREAGSVRHSKAVAGYAELIARELGLPADRTERIRLGAVLHDVGKIGVPDTVQRKVGPLTEEDWVEMRKHPQIAAHILEGTSVEDIRGWVLLHHERLDGQGYPHGLHGDEIPLEARIIAVADAYEAMTTDRPYRSALGQDEACNELERATGSHFDETVVAALLAALKRMQPENAAH